MSQQIKIENQWVEFYNFNDRSELHGDEHMPAFDMHCRIRANNAVLDQIDPRLLPGFYTDDMPGQDEEIKQLAGMDKKNHLRVPILRFPVVLEIKKMTGARVTIPWGPNDEIVFGNCTVDSFKLECLEGGTVVVTFKFSSVYEPEEHAMKLLCIRHGGETELTIEPAQPELPMEGESSDDEHPDPDATNDDDTNPFGKSGEKSKLSAVQ